MSVESAKAFYTRLQTDEAFRNQYQHASTNEARQAFIQASDYDFTTQDWHTVIHQAQQETVGSLSDEELESVAGGMRPPITGPITTLPLPISQTPFIYPSSGTTPD
jgi:predicted ribosomally synthesized peptide with nif11-like leader